MSHPFESANYSGIRLHKPEPVPADDPQGVSEADAVCRWDLDRAATQGQAGWTIPKFRSAADEPRIVGIEIPGKLEGYPD